MGTRDHCSSEAAAADAVVRNRLAWAVGRIAWRCVLSESVEAGTQSHGDNGKFASSWSGAGVPGCTEDRTRRVGAVSGSQDRRSVGVRNRQVPVRRADAAGRCPKDGGSKRPVDAAAGAALSAGQIPARGVAVAG